MSFVAVVVKLAEFRAPLDPVEPSPLTSNGEAATFVYSTTEIQLEAVPEKLAVIVMLPAAALGRR